MYQDHQNIQYGFELGYKGHSVDTGRTENIYEELCQCASCTPIPLYPMPTLKK